MASHMKQATAPKIEVVDAGYSVEGGFPTPQTIPGLDESKRGKHLLLPLGYSGPVPSGYHVWRSTTCRLLVGVRSLPVGGDVDAALERIIVVMSDDIGTWRRALTPWSSARGAGSATWLQSVARGQCFSGRLLSHRAPPSKASRRRQGPSPRIEDGHWVPPSAR